MYGNGVRTGMVRSITTKVQSAIRRVRQSALFVLFAVVVGSSVLSFYVALLDCTTAQSTGTSFLDFVAPRMLGDCDYIVCWLRP